MNPFDSPTTKAAVAFTLNGLSSREASSEIKIPPSNSSMSTVKQKIYYGIEGEVSDISSEDQRNMVLAPVTTFNPIVTRI